MRSNVSGLPPTMTESLPCWRVMTLPETGASTMSAPFSRTLAASARLTAGLTVLISTQTLPGPSPSNRPFGPSATCVNGLRIHEHRERDIRRGGYGAGRILPFHAFIDQPLRFRARAVVSDNRVAFLQKAVRHLTAHHS